VKRKYFIRIFACIIVSILLIQFVPMISLRTISMRNMVIDNFSFYYEKSDDKTVDAVLKVLNENSSRVKTSLKIKENALINVYIYSSVYSLHLHRFGFFIGIFLPDWYVGDNTNQSVLIVSPNNPGSAHSYESIMGACVHEYVHVLTDRINPNTEKWIKEGIAVYLAGQKPERSSIRRASIAFSDFSNINGLKFGKIGGYPLSYILIEFIEKKYGFDKILELINSNNDYAKTFGKGKREIYDEWMDYLSKI